MRKLLVKPRSGISYDAESKNRRFISAGNEPGGHACIHIWRLP